MEPGLYVTFFTEGEPMEGELPPVGPLEHVVVRDGPLLADRKDAHPADAFEGGQRWVEAEYEFQRAVGNEPGGPRRRDLRIVAPQGVYLRFVSFGSAADHDPIPELGPYAVVVIDKHAVEADGDRLASRTGTEAHLWELTGSGGTTFVGIRRPDIAFRTRSTLYHPALKPFRTAPAVAAPAHATKSHPAAAHAPRPAKVERATELAPRPPKAEPARALPPRAPAAAQVAEAAATLRDRIGSEPSTRGLRYAVAEPLQREWGGAAWRLRYLIIGALVVLIAVFSVPFIRSGLTGGGTTSEIVGPGTAVSSPEWTYNVGNVRRVARIGPSEARGTYLVVQIAATNRARAGAQLSPSNFTLTSASGEQYAAQPTSSVVYSAANPESSYTWATAFPVGRPVVVPLIFEINTAVSGTQLMILDVPTTRIRLE